MLCGPGAAPRLQLPAVQSLPPRVAALPQRCGPPEQPCAMLPRGQLAEPASSFQAALFHPGLTLPQTPQQRHFSKTPMPAAHGHHPLIGPRVPCRLGPDARQQRDLPCAPPPIAADLAHWTQPLQHWKQAVSAESTLAQPPRLWHQSVAQQPSPPSAYLPQASGHRHSQAPLCPGGISLGMRSGLLLACHLQRWQSCAMALSSHQFPPWPFCSSACSEPR